MTDKYAPPGKLVAWSLVHKDGRHSYQNAKTAFFAAQAAGWSLSELVECKPLDAPIPDPAEKRPRKKT